MLVGFQIRESSSKSKNVPMHHEQKQQIGGVSLQMKELEVAHFRTPHPFERSVDTSHIAY